MCQLTVRLLMNNSQEEQVQEVSHILVEMDKITLIRLFEAPRVLHGFYIKEIDCMRNSVYLEWHAAH